MAIKLNLVKSRLISSKEDLISFRKEATAALLKFADSNDCDLDRISQLLVAKYAEIDKALNDGYQVESEVEIYPQPAVAPVARQACMEPAKVPTTDEDVRRMIAASPQKQATANKIMAIASRLGQTVAWDLLTRIATGAYTAAELRELTGALRVVAAEDDEEAEAAPASAAEEPTGHEPKPSTTPEASEAPNVGASSELNSLLQQFNAEINAVDPAHKLLKPITMDEVKATPPATPGEEDEAIPAAAPAAPVEPEVAPEPEATPEPEAAPEPAAEAAPEQAEAPKYHVIAEQDPTMGEQWLVINDATGDTEFQGASESEAKEYMDSLLAEQQGK